MPTTLLGLGSNLGDNEATLLAALAEIANLPDVQIVRHSKWHRSRPVGGPPGKPITSTAQPSSKRKSLRSVVGRTATHRITAWPPRAERWCPARSISTFCSTATKWPKRRCSRCPIRGCLTAICIEPAAEIAPRMLHPIIGWPIEQLLLHLQSASDRSRSCRHASHCEAELANMLVEHCGVARMTVRRYLRRPITTGRRCGLPGLDCRLINPSNNPQRIPQALSLTRRQHSRS